MSVFTGLCVGGPRNGENVSQRGTRFGVFIDDDALRGDYLGSYEFTAGLWAWHAKRTGLLLANLETIADIMANARTKRSSE